MDKIHTVVKNNCLFNMVEKYLERIKYKGSTSANLESLKKLQQQHLLHVPFETDYLVDAGFGEFTFSPLQIEFDKIQNDKRGQFTITKYEGDYLQVNKLSENGWRPEYIFTLKERLFSEFEPMCLYHQTSPQSHFTKNKLCSILTKEGNNRITITNNKLKITGGDKTKEESINDDKEFEKYLWEYFQIKVS